MIANSFDLKKDVLLRELRGRILGGHYAHGEKLPVEVHLAEELSVSRDTLRAALKQLETEGLLVRIRSKGTFVNTIPFEPLSKSLESSVLFEETSCAL